MVVVCVEHFVTMYVSRQLSQAEPSQAKSVHQAMMQQRLASTTQVASGSMSVTLLFAQIFSVHFKKPDFRTTIP